MKDFRSLVESKQTLNEEMSHPIDKLFGDSYSTDAGQLNLVHKLPNLSKEHIKIAAEKARSNYNSSSPHHENVRRAILANPRLENTPANLNNYYRPELGDKPHMVANKGMRDILSHREAMQGRDNSHSKNYQYTAQDHSMINDTKSRNDVKHETHMEAHREKLVSNKNPNERLYDHYQG